MGNSDSVNCNYAGYFTLDVNQEIHLNKGDDFYILMRYVTPNDTTPLPIEAKIDGYSNPHIKQNKCWINPNYKNWPTTWYACGSNSKYLTLNFDLCIKAYCIRKK